jgi:hypothetical protein
VNTNALCALGACRGGQIFERRGGDISAKNNEKHAPSQVAEGAGLQPDAMQSLRTILLEGFFSRAGRRSGVDLLDHHALMEHVISSVRTVYSSTYNDNGQKSINPSFLMEKSC